MIAKMILISSKARKVKELLDQLNGYMDREFVKRETDSEVMQSCHEYDSRLSSIIFYYTFTYTFTVLLKPVFPMIAGDELVRLVH